MRNEKTDKIIGILLFLIPILLILWYWKNTLIHLSTHLYDWHDVPFVIWVFQNNIKSIGLFDFMYHNETNAMYPFPYSLSFTEHMYFPSILIYIISWFTSNPIAQFNVLAVLNHILVYISSYLLLSRFSKNHMVRVLVAFFFAFSPYMYLQSGHFQMLFVWPVLLSLYFMLHPDRQLQHFLLSGLFMAWQFMSAVYLGIMGFFIVGVYYFLKLFFPRLFPDRKRTKKEMENEGKAFLFGYYTKWDTKSMNDKLRIFAEFAVIFLTFLIVAEPTIEAYFEMQSAYKPVLEQGQYVNFAAHISDYLFPSGQPSILYKFLSFWKSFDMHVVGEKAAFIGIAPFAVIGYWLIKFWKKAQSVSKWVLIWVMVLIAGSFIFSLGPRFNFNGKYLVTPLPYLVILKTIPFLGVMRALARWYFVIILAVSVLLTLILDSLRKKLLWIVLILLVVEFYPTPLPATTMDWNPKAYRKVREICQSDSGPMLEYPFDYRAPDSNISKDLTYKNTILMASTTHSCDILSGFTAYRPKKYIEYRDFLQNNEFNRGGLKLLYDVGFRYVKFNLNAMNPEEKRQIKKFARSRYVGKIYEEKEVLIIKLRQLTKYEMIE